MHTVLYDALPYVIGAMGPKPGGKKRDYDAACFSGRSKHSDYELSLPAGLPAAKFRAQVPWTVFLLLSIQPLYGFPLDFHFETVSGFPTLDVASLGPAYSL